jgi:hypothetical protein
MRSGSVAKGESSSEVASELADLLDVLKQLSVNSLLGSLQLLSPLGLSGLALFNSF